MKKTVLILMSIMLCFFHTQALASVPSVAMRSEIRAFIDYTPIESYLINGYTYIPADHLSDYGFTVTYDDASHSLIISRIKFATPLYTKEMWESATAKKVSADIIDSNVKVYLDGQLVDSYAIDGQTLIMLDELQKYGTFERDEYSKKVSITIFKDEMQREFEGAENIVEIKYAKDPLSDIPRNYVISTDENNGYFIKYIGQIDENNVPNGIGMIEISYEMTKITYMGYFSSGTINGLVYKETSHYVSRSYMRRNIRFIGKIDGAKESKREHTSPENSPSTIILLREPNFGISILPIREIPEWTGPEVLPDRTIYTQGCYYESWDGEYSTHEYRIWHDGNETQTIADTNFGSLTAGPNKMLFDVVLRLKSENKSVLSGTDFYEYKNSEKLFYNGSIQTISGTGSADDPLVLNDPAVGGGQIPLFIPVVVNGKELMFDVSPVMESGRVLVPVRAIFESLGAQISWDEDTQKITATKGNKVILLQINNNIMQIDGKSIILDVPPRVVNGRTLVPVRAVAEGFETIINWDENTKTVSITD